MECKRLHTKKDKQDHNPCLHSVRQWMQQLIYELYMKQWNIQLFVIFVLSLSRARPSAGDNRNEHWSHSHTPVEHITSSSHSLHGNHVYASISGYAVDQPLALTKSSHDIGLGGRERSVMSGAVERQQVRKLVSLIEGKVYSYSK